MTPRTTGRVAGAILRPGITTIAAGAIPVDGPELAVTSSVARALAPEPVGGLDVRLLDLEIDAKLAALGRCRTDVARHKRVPPGRIRADTLTLRWTILGKGQVDAMDVVGSTPVDPDVLDCVKRDATGWQFTAPVGGDVRLNRVLVFRRLPAAAPRSTRGSGSLQE